MFDVKLSITGLQQAQQRNLRAIAALSPSGALGRAIKLGTVEAHRYAVAITHVDTGSLKASHRIELTNDRGRVFIDPAAVNPRRGRPVEDYAIWEHRRGGTHAFYERVVSERGQQIGAAMSRLVKVGIHGG